VQYIVGYTTQKRAGRSDKFSSCSSIVCIYNTKKA